MYKKLSFFTFIPSIIIVALLNLLLFLTVPNARLETFVFWIGWGFTFPINIAIAVMVWIFIHKKTAEREENTIIYLPLLTYVIFAGTAVYLVTGIIFMYCPIMKATAPLIVEAFVTGLYISVLCLSIFTTDRLANNQKEVHEKVAYLRLLQADIDSCILNINDENLLAKIRTLSEKIRFSDPMSHPSLAACEAELSNVVMTIVTKVNTSSTEGIEDDIIKASSLVDFRNNRCKILK